MKRGALIGLGVIGMAAAAVAIGRSYKIAPLGPSGEECFEGMPEREAALVRSWLEAEPGSTIDYLGKEIRVTPSVLNMLGDAVGAAGYYAAQQCLYRRALEIDESDASKGESWGP